jgi:tetratricopeptide (TPR) repeat protein
MKLQVKPNAHNVYPLHGLFVRGSKPVFWLQQLQKLAINLDKVEVFALPGNTPNSVWGCFIALPHDDWKHKSLDAAEPCQCVHDLLFIPQYACIQPVPGVAEIPKLFAGIKHFLHPEIGLVVLDAPLDWNSLLSIPEQDVLHIIKPDASVFIPGKIRSAEIFSLPPDDVLKHLEDRAFPATKKFTDKPLSIAERIKLGILKTLFTKGKNQSGSQALERSGLMKLLEKFTGKMFPGIDKWLQNMEQDLQELEKRSRSEMEKLMELFARNPDEALKYAIPLDDNGATRGGMKGSFEMSNRWGNFDLFGRDYNGNGSILFADDTYNQLHQQYRKTAADLIKDGKYERAAFVYLKLLKDHNSAAETLEEGKLYPEAASVYLKHLRNKNKAAACYEKGQMISNAIALYKELKEFEKTGDLYMLQQKQKEAFEYYQLVANDHIAAGRYVKASVLMRNKMHNAEPAQDILLQGWRKNFDAFNCINNYFQNIDDPASLLHAIDWVYKNETNVNNKSIFLKALSYEYKKSDAVAGPVKEMAYEIVSGMAYSNPEIVTELKNFNKDKSLVKDLMRFKVKKR